MRVLVACERSGIVREAFRRRGHDAWSCDLEPADDGGPHIQGDVREILDDGWGLMVAHPPCTELARSGGKRFWSRQLPALEFVRELMNAPIPRWCIENPIGAINTKLARPSQIVHPYQFGYPATKATCLWLKNLPLLEPTVVVEPVHSFTDNITGHNRQRNRSVSFEGMASAMAGQWAGIYEAEHA
jgi:hypothetical protein